MELEKGTFQKIPLLVSGQSVHVSYVTKNLVIFPVIFYY